MNYVIHHDVFIQNKTTKQKGTKTNTRNVVHYDLVPFRLVLKNFDENNFNLKTISLEKFV